MSWRFVLLLTLATPAWACFCVGNGPSVKQAWEKAPAVFLGTVELADPDGDPRQTMFAEQSVRIHVDEAFKGVFSGQTIILHEGGNDCAAKFRTGQHAVFYLYGGAAPESWDVAACTRSVDNGAPLGDDLLFLRGLPQSATRTRFSGEVELYEDLPAEAFHRAGGVPGVTVRISGAKGFIREVVTNADGAYEIYNLPPGKYSADIAAPRGLRITFPLITGAFAAPGTTTVDLELNGGVSVSFILKADTRLTGRMLDASGKPITDVCLDLEPLEGRDENGARFFDCSKKDGVFSMEMMPPGEYRLVARDELTTGGHKSRSTLYYPGMRDRDRATIISIEAGKYVEHIDVRMPSNEKRYLMTGRMQFQDAVPIANGAITFTSARSGYTETTDTAADGSFVFLVVAGMEGELRGEAGVMTPILKSCPEFKVEPRVAGIFHFIDTSPLTQVSDSDRENLKLIVPFASCKSWPAARR